MVSLHFRNNTVLRVDYKFNEGISNKDRSPQKGSDLLKKILIDINYKSRFNFKFESIKQYLISLMVQQSSEQHLLFVFFAINSFEQYAQIFTI